MPVKLRPGEGKTCFSALRSTPLPSLLSGGYFCAAGNLREPEKGVIDNALR
jgi:hypothetical protein